MVKICPILFDNEAILFVVSSRDKANIFRKNVKNICRGIFTCLLAMVLWRKLLFWDLQCVKRYFDIGAISLHVGAMLVHRASSYAYVPVITSLDPYNNIIHNINQQLVKNNYYYYSVYKHSISDYNAIVIHIVTSKGSWMELQEFHNRL